MGLVQKKIEAAGISTITLSAIPDLTTAVGAPRVAAIEHPLGLAFGQRGDRQKQLAVLRATLTALAETREPGSVTHLPFEWSEPRRNIGNRPPQAPPIAKYLLRRPWLLPRLFSRDVPEENRVYWPAQTQVAAAAGQ